MSKKRVFLLVIIGICIVTCVIMGVSYAFFSGGKNYSNANVLYDTSFSNGSYNFTAAVNSASSAGISLNLSAADMFEGIEDLVADSYNVIFDISFQNTSSSVAVCTYDYVWTWKSTSPNPYAISSGATKELTVSGAINEMQVPNSTEGSMVLGRATIQANANATTTRQDTLTAKFYNLVGIDQSAHSNKTYQGYLSIAHAHCRQKPSSQTLVDYLTYDAPRAGYDAVTNKQWMLVSDRAGEYRYAGRNPNNYITFNGELWRIIGVIPSMVYCTGTYGNATECDTTTVGSLVKIVRNDSLGTYRIDYKGNGVGTSTHTYGSNDWSDSQLMLMLNGTNYLNTSYDANGNKLHTGYIIASNVVKDAANHSFYNATYSYLDGSGTTVYVPSSATTSSYTATSGTVPKKIASTALNQIATVKWDLYGTANYSINSQGSPTVLYNKERNIGGIGSVYDLATLAEKRAVYWYGKVALMYLSDYGYATSGGGSRVRSACLAGSIGTWNSNTYKTDCAANSYLWYIGITSTPPTSDGVLLKTLSPYSSTAQSYLALAAAGNVTTVTAYGTTSNTRPVVYLKETTLISGTHTGTWDDPYVIS